jgi:AbrB family looped-hinge helix DNA binding protein
MTCTWRVHSVYTARTWQLEAGMSLKTVVTMNPHGRVTIPAAARERLHVKGETQFEVEVTEHEMIFRPAVVIPREDAWAYRPEHLALVARAREDLRTGRLRMATDADLGGPDEPEEDTSVEASSGAAVSAG